MHRLSCKNGTKRCRKIILYHFECDNMAGVALLYGLFLLLFAHINEKVGGPSHENKGFYF
jgi:hypothetical protein